MKKISALICVCAMLTVLSGAAVDIQPAGDGLCEGYTKTYVRVRAQAQPGELKTVRIVRADGALLFGE